MKTVLGMIAVLTVAAVFLALNQSADASPSATIKLNAGQNAVVSANACTLAVLKDTSALVKVKCKANPSVESATLAEAVMAKITLSAGQSVKIVANDCLLKVVKNKPATVKVKCNPNPTPTPTATEVPDASVTVGPGGLFKYSGDVNIHVGDTVEWTWASGPHTVTSGNGTPDDLFCSPNDTDCSTAAASSTGAKYRHTFTSVGSFQYYCRIHGIQMTAKVNVSP